MGKCIKLNEKTLHNYVHQCINEWFKEPSEPKKVLICNSIIDGYEANEIAMSEGYEKEWMGAKFWFEGTIDYESEFELKNMPKYNQFITHMDYVDADLYYDYGANYYFAVRECNQSDMAMSESRKRNLLYNIIKESINESYNQYGVWDLIDELKEVMSAEDILTRIIARISPIEAKRMLEDILSIEGPEYDEEE